MDNFFERVNDAETSSATVSDFHTILSAMLAENQPRYDLPHWSQTVNNPSVTSPVFHESLRHRNAAATNQFAERNYFRPFSSASSGTARNIFAPALAGAPNDSLPNDDSGLPHHVLHLIRESYDKICNTFRIPGIMFNVRQLQCIVNELLKPAMDATLPHLERLNPDATVKCGPLLKEFLYLIKSVESLVEFCSNQRWWIYALTCADGGTNFSFFYYELAKCVVLAQIVYTQFTNPKQEDFEDLVRFTLEDEETVIRSVVCKPGDTDIRDIDTRKVQVMCEDILHNEPNAFYLEKEKLPLAKLLSSKLSKRGEDRFDVQRSSSFTIPDDLCISPQDLIWQKPLGQGAYGTVHEVHWLGNRFAGKLFQTTDNESFKQEAAIISRLQHPSIVQLWGCCIDEKRNTCSLILDLMSKDLFDFLESRASAAPPGSQALSYPVAVSIMLQIAEGMRYLHSQGVMHRDMKAKNVLVDLFHPVPLLAEEGFVWVKVCDFGMAKTKLASSNFTSPHLGTPYWRAPEVFKDEALEKKYTKKADVYSFAMTCVEILNAKPPFDEIPLKDLYRMITAEGMRPSLPSSCPRYLAAYLRRCWATDPNLRPPFSEICRMLRHLKGLLIRTGSENECVFSCVKEVDLEEMARHLGVKWCITESLQSRRVPKEVIVRFLLKTSSNERFTSNPDFQRALICMGDELANMKGSKHDFKQAILLFQLAARQGSAEAQWKLGLFFELGLGVEKDEDEAIRLYLEEAAEQDHPNAYVELGRCFDCGRGVELSDKMASFYWGRAIKHQIATGKTLQCVSELIEIVTHGSDPDLCEVAAVRLWELSIRSRIGREILAGPNCVNVKTLVAALADPKTLDISKHMITLMLPNLALESEVCKVVLEAGGVGALVSFLGATGLLNHRWRAGLLTAFEKLFSMKEGAARSEAVRSGIIPSLLSCLRHDPVLASKLLIQCLEADTAKSWLSNHKNIVLAIFRINSTTHPGVSSINEAHMKKQLSSLGFDTFY